jgi:phage tail sheath gpL-like
MASNAVGAERISAVVGYLIAKGNFQTSSPNLPQRVAVLCEANTANQATLDLTPYQATSAQAVGAKYGYGSPAYHIARIALPLNGGGLGGIPIVFYPQAAAIGSVAKVIQIAPAGVATGNATHTIKIAGRTNVDSQFYNINVVAGDTIAIITSKITDVVNAVLGAPVISSDNDYVTTLTAKWKGLTSNDITVSVDTNNNPVGISYWVNTTVSGSGTPSIAPALALYGSDWNTITINSYGTVTSIMDALEAFNGIPDNTNPTGRYTGIVMKPTIALTGSIADDPSSITDSRKLNCTISISPAPASTGLPMEAAANDAVLFAVTAQNTPELDILNKFYSDMPTPTLIGSMADYNNRDLFVKKGCSTVDLVSGKYQVKDPVTTYHPDGEIPPQFRYRRDMMIDWNIRYGYYLLEQLYVVGKVIANDEDIVSSQNVVKPKQWKQIIKKYFDDLVSRGLIVDSAFSNSSLSVGISSVNPNRFETTFSIKRSGVARISATTATMGFNFGTLNT